MKIVFGINFLLPGRKQHQQIAPLDKNVYDGETKMILSLGWSLHHNDKQKNVLPMLHVVYAWKLSAMCLLVMNMALVQG